MKNYLNKLILSAIIITFLGIFINTCSASAENVNYEVNIEPALNITVTSDGVVTNNVTLDLNPLNHTFDSKSIDVKVSTNNVTGYQLFVSTSNGSTALTRNTSGDSANNVVESTIPTLANPTSDTTSSSFETNKWGYRIVSSTTNPDKVTNYYNPFTLNNNLAVSHYATNGDTTTLDFAAKIDWNQPAGTYENTLVFTATATYAAYDIKYYDGVDNTEESYIAHQTNSYNTSSKVKLDPTYKDTAYTTTITDPDTGNTITIPARNTYDFIKWCDQLPTADTNNYFPATVCNGNTYNTGDAITINPEDYNTNIKLYAYWDPTTFEEAYAAAGESQTSGYYVMQDMSSDICKAVTINEVTQLKDNRIDGSVTHNYYVAKLKDGKCWMTQDLKLGTNSTSITLTKANSNITANSWALNGKLSNGKFPAVKCEPGSCEDRYGTASYYDNDNAYYCTPVSGNNYVSCTYNWFSATAGTGTSSITPVGDGTGLGYVDVDYSICPANWHLPSGGGMPLSGNISDRPDSDFNILYTNYPTPGDMLMPDTTCSNAGDSGCDNLTGLPIPGLLLSGYYTSTGPKQVGQVANYWSRSAWSIGNAYVLAASHSGANPKSYSHKSYSASVRCLAYSS